LYSRHFIHILPKSMPKKGALPYLNQINHVTVD
jgi:hypothetical protein